MREALGASVREREAMFRPASAGRAFLALSLLGACGAPSASYLYKEGGTVARADNDYFACELDAARGVPQDTRVATTPVYTTPVKTSCTPVGDSVECTTTGGEVSGGEVYSYDANADLRTRYLAQCLRARGYSSSVLPRCKSGSVSSAALQTLGGALRPPRDGACYVSVTEHAGNIAYPYEISR